MLHIANITGRANHEWPKYDCIQAELEANPRSAILGSGNQKGSGIPREFSLVHTAVKLTPKHTDTKALSWGTDYSMKGREGVWRSRCDERLLARTGHSDSVHL